MAHHWKYEAELPAGREHSVQVQTDSPGADFNLLVLDRAGNVLAADRGPEPGARCDLVTEQTQPVVFVVELLSGSGSFSLQVASQPLSRPAARPAPKRQASERRVRRRPGVMKSRPAPVNKPEIADQEQAGDDTGSDLTGVEARALLASHNEWRARFGTAPLRWSSELAEYAQAWADELEATGMRMRHRSPNDFGENLYWCSGKAASPADVVDAWGNEVDLYDYAANDWWPDAGHFSQVVWHSTTEVGGAVVRHNGQELWVCNYNPRGNWTGKRPYEK